MTTARTRAPTGPPPPFAEVLASARLGLPWALELLYEELAPRVAAYLRSQRASDVADLTNEVFIRVFGNLDRFDGDEGGFRSWVFTIAHHQVVDQRRRDARRPRLDEWSEANERVIGQLDADLQVVDRRVIDDLLSVLSPDQRDVILLRVIADLSVEQVARALGKRRGAVRALQHRALASLRRHLERRGVSQ